MRIAPELAVAYFYRAQALKGAGRGREADSDFLKACQLGYDEACAMVKR
jgi:hypothetical protein